MNKSDNIQLPNIDLDDLDRQNAEEEAVLQAEIDAIKQEYVERFGEPLQLNDTTTKEAV